jgi:hypothetical protein
MKKLVLLVFVLLVILIVAVPLIFGQEYLVVELPSGFNALICSDGNRPDIVSADPWGSSPYVVALCFADADSSFLPLVNNE